MTNVTTLSVRNLRADLMLIVSALPFISNIKRRGDIEGTLTSYKIGLDTLPWRHYYAFYARQENIF